jgi:uncharacterized protein involved in outer membrane biogenesis
MKAIEEIRKRPRLKKGLIGALIFLLLFTITGFFVVPPVLKSVLIKKLSERLHREVAIQKISVNPFLLSLDIKGVVVKDREKSGIFFSFDGLYTNLQTASIWKGGPILKEIKLEGPYINVIRNEDGTYNFSDLLEEGKPKSTTPSNPLKFSLNNIQILNGSADFLDGPKHTKHKARDIVIKIPFISNLPHYVDTFVQPLIQARINDTLISFKGKSKPFTDSLETAFDVNVKDFNIPYYLSYVPFKMNFRVLSGYIDTRAGVSYTQYRSKAPTLALTGDIAVKKVQVADENNERMISLPMIDVSVASSDIISKKVHFSRVYFQSPEISLSRNKKGEMNLEALMPKGDAAAEKEESKPMAIDADEMKVTGGRISFSDSSKAANFKTTLENIDLNIAHFSNGPDKKAALGLTFETEAKEALKLAGDFSVDPMTAEGTLELKGIPIKKYSPYFSENVLFDIEGAQLDFHTRYSYTKKGEGPEFRLSGLAADLNSLRLKKRGEKEDFLKIPVVSIRDTDADLSKKELVVGTFSTQKGLVSIKRFNDGRLNVEGLLPSAPPKEEKTLKAKKVQTEKPWQILIKDLALEGYTVKVEDLVPHRPVETSVEKIRITGKNIATAKNNKGRLAASLVLNKRGRLSTNGTVSINPLALNMKLNANAMDIVPFQPYFTDRVKIILTEGAVSASGNMTFAYQKDGGPKIVYSGDASIANFSSLDKANAEDFLKWNSLHFGNINTGYNPSYVDIREIAISDFYSRFIINADGSLNVQGIVEEEAPKKGAAPQNEGAGPAADKKDPPAKTIKIGSVTLQGGKINFSDNHIRPNYSANLMEIGGRISGLSSEEDKFADVDLRGKLDNHAPLQITGKINPLREDLFVDLKVDFKDMELSPMTPYSGKYIGYTIQKGKLALNLQYLIVKKKLDSQNTIFLDQFTLGDKVESPDATKLPVRLAIALLKNRKGEIKLDIPVTGYLDDPKFSLGRIILKIIVNLLAKAATSPFALLGAIFGGGGEELSHVDFGYGSSLINEEELKKIDKLVKALYDRPALKLEIEGHVDTERDREGLRDYIFNKKIKAQKLKDMIKKGLPPVAVDMVKVEKEEYPKYLKMAYKQEKFPKPRNIIGIAKDLPVSEMEKLMITHIEIKDDDLRKLASQRALLVKDHILKSGQVEPERVFLVEPKTLPPEKKEKLRDSRVDFRLK